MKLIKTAGVLAVACGLVALSPSSASAQPPTVSWQALSSTSLRVDWTPVPQATSYEVFVSGAAIGTVGPIPVSTTFFVVGPVPAGTYQLAVRGRAGSTLGPLSNPVSINMGGAAAPAGCSIDAPSVNTSTTGNLVNVTWNAVGGAVGYRLQVGTAPGATQLSRDVEASQTSVSASIPALGTFYVRVLTGNACGAQATSTEKSFTIGSATPGPAPGPGSGPRTPDPAPGSRLPLPGYGFAIVEAVARAFPGDLHNSCVEHGGNNVFMLRVVQALRQLDSRWGLNWKRGNRGDLSQDIAAYNFGPGPDEDSTNVYIVDIIGGHCGSAYPNWQDQTGATQAAGSIGRWTLQPYLRAGLPADPRQ